MGAVRTMGRRRLERERRVKALKAEIDKLQYRIDCDQHFIALLKQDKEYWQECVADPEGTIQRGINERYSNDLRQRELEHHASWDAEVVVHKMAAARWMRSCVLEVVKDEAVRGQIEALPLVPGDA
jgi:hypothetical protein